MPPLTGSYPHDGDLETHLVISDGARTWEPGDLAAVITATTTDPAWLQLQAAINNARDQEKYHIELVTPPPVSRHDRMFAAGQPAA